MKSHKLTGFSVVFLYSEPIKGVDISDLKKALGLDEKEKVTLVEIGDLGVGVLSLDQKKKRISLEGSRIVFTDGGVSDNDPGGLIQLIEPTLGIVGKFPLKAIGFNYDAVISKDKEARWQDFFSSSIGKMIESYGVSGFGIKLSLSKGKKKYNVDITSVDGHKDSLLIHFNDHNEAKTVPELKNLLVAMKDGYNALLDFIKPISD